MTLRTAHLVGIAIIGATMTVSAAVYGDLPAQMPMHWNVHGEIDGWAPRALGAYFLPLLTLGLLGLLAVVGRSPAQQVPSFAPRYARFELVFIAFMSAVHVAILAAALGARVPMLGLVGVGLGLLIAAAGDMMRGVPRNAWIGFRTRRTLASDEVWTRTHMLASKLFIAAGLVTVAVAFAPYGILIGVAAILVASLVATVRSYR